MSRRTNKYIGFRRKNTKDLYRLNSVKPIDVQLNETYYPTLNLVIKETDPVSGLVTTTNVTINMSNPIIPVTTTGTGHTTYQVSGSQTTDTTNVDIDPTNPDTPLTPTASGNITYEASGEKMNSPNTQPF